MDIDRDGRRRLAIAELDRELAAADVDMHGVPREERMDHARRLDVVRRQHTAMRDRVIHLVDDDERPTVLLIHRHPWFCEKLTSAASGLGLKVVGTVDNGAEGVGIAAAEQPDVVVLDEHVAMVTSTSVLQLLGTYAPETRVLVQVATSEAMGQFLDAGAHEVVMRCVPPSDVAAALWSLCRRDAPSVSA